MENRVCNMCSKEVPSMALLGHIPQCYRTMCFNMGIVPLCTCNTCKGSRAHEGDGPAGEVAVKKLAQEDRPNKKIKVEPEASNETKDARPKVETPVLQGKCCIFCNKKGSQTPFPTIHIGQFRKVVICKKAHLVDPEDKHLMDAVQHTID